MDGAHECDGIVTLQSEMQETDQGEEIADMKGASRRIYAEVDSPRLLDMLSGRPAVHEWGLARR